MTLPLRETFLYHGNVNRINVPIPSAALSVFSCACPTRAFRFHIPLFKGVAEAALHCAHRTSTFLSCAFCEQEGHLAAPLSPSKPTHYLPGMGFD